jgi:hypothetical protein
MSDFQKSVDRDDSKIGWVGVSPIQKNKQGKEDLYSFSGTEYRKTDFVPVAAFIIWFKKLLNAFSAKSRSSSMAAEQQQLVEDLLAFKKMLQILANEDQSHNPEFTQQFSELWHSLIDDCNHLEPFERKNHFQIAQIKLLIEKMCAYPPFEEHSLGYYLNKYAGNEWLPFPFMDILHKLHQEHQESSESGHLELWTSSLNSIISSLDLPADLSPLSE